MKRATTDQRLQSALRGARGGSRVGCLGYLCELERTGQLATLGRGTVPPLMVQVMQCETVTTTPLGKERGLLLRLHPYRVQKNVRNSGSWWTPARVQDSWWQCGHCKGSGRVHRTDAECWCAACSRAKLGNKCPGCHGSGSKGHSHAPGGYALCPTTDRGAFFYLTEHTRGFRGFAELCDYLHERLVAWKVGGALPPPSRRRRRSRRPA